MSQHPDLVDQTPMRRRDAGFTLPEMLISVAISGILIVAIAIAFTTVLRTEASASSRLAESKDITFVQTWLPVDLSSAIASHDEADEAALATALATSVPGGPPPMSVNHDFGPDSTNVLTLVRPDLDAGAGVYYVVTYRYEQVNGEWRISRYEIRNPGTPSETVKTVGVAYEVPSPPVGWVSKTTPTFAAEVIARTQYIRPVGEDVKFKFESGKTFVSGGGGLSAQNELDSNGSGGLKNPSAPPSRCGGRIALVIDTSGSVPAGNGDEATKDAAAGFIRGFTGTPTTLSLNGFDMEAYGMGITAGSKVNNGVRSPYLSLLDPGPTVEGLVTRVTDLDNFGPPSWPGAGGGPTSAKQAQRDPNGDGIHWDQIYTSTKSGTNWEDGLWNVFRDSSGNYYGTEQPELLVFITDGEPNLVRTASGGWADASESAATDAAVAVARRAKSDGTRVIGVMVGNKSTDTGKVNQLKRVVGELEYNPALNNAGTASLFKGQFSELGTILRSILIAECGGTLTVQKRIDTGSGLVKPATGTWTMTASDLGDRPLDVEETSSVTFDYGFGAGETSKTVQVTEAGGGFVYDRTECTSNGVPVAVGPPEVAGTAGFSIELRPDKAVSCLMISRP
ncbi:MAG TPA: prepilin-type N-terminal cleavage/methylation domain-containing protein [Ilumatobacteraceae bacterium]|nr:prepilin-type N-terminal cleavage/methylation domain-containing protein [Ilumatobacteraceae bacterium]